LYFCSRKCKDDAQKIGGVQEIMPPHYGRSNGKNVYKNLIENTCSPTCIGCSEINKYLLCVHHIDGNRNNNALSNLEIVCGNCHIKRHLKLINGEWVYDCDYLTDRDLLCML
jgi:5-methylcytosine-specific restriction endonuclease McrA